ncbi:hypothetical protein ACPXCO_24220 [Streptomyces cyaneofuscatus]|uniref:hypothetical protein n=1 Tax=Streptomyces cyaneofuscatus TaxID=66883 RepID=UPI003CFA2FC1
MPKKLTYPKAERALRALNALYECTDLTAEERENVERAANTVRALCDRIPDPDQTEPELSPEGALPIA